MLRTTRASLALVLLGCGNDAPATTRAAAPPTAEVRFEVGGASVAIPGDAATPDPAQAQHILARYGRTPDDRDVAIRRRPDGVIVLLEHQSQPLVARGGENVGGFLDELLDDLRLASRIAPGDPRVTRRRRDGAIEDCITSEVGPPPRTLTSCVLASIDAAGTDLVVDTVHCEADGAGDATCARVVDTFASAGAKLALDRTLEARRAPGLPDVTADAFAWMRLGATAREVEAACVGAGGHLEPVDPRDAPPPIVAAAAAGRFLMCVDGGTSSLGPITLTHATFDAEGRLSEAVSWVSADHAQLSATLARAYPDYLAGDAMGMIAYFVDRDATGYGLLAITASPSTSRPGQTMLRVVSRRGYESSPL